MTQKSTGKGPELSPEDRQDAAMVLRARGMTYREISKALAYSGPGAAKDAVDAAAGRARDSRETDVGLAIEIAVMGYNAIIHAHWDAAMAGRATSTDQVIRAMKERNALLGLEAPKKIELSGNDAGPGYRVVIERRVVGDATDYSQ